MKLDLKQIAIPALFVGMMVVIALSRAGFVRDPSATYPQALVTTKSMSFADQCPSEELHKDQVNYSSSGEMMTDPARCVGPTTKVNQ